MQTAWNLPEISNSLMEEQKKIFDPFSHSYENMLSRDSILLLYTKKNPNSYLNLWKLIDNMAVGYKAIYDSIFKLLPAEIKSCYAGKVLAKKLQSSRILAFGNKFPDMSLLSTSMKPITISSKSNGYTLYDFWFSHCIPCISQFPELKKIYAEYHQMGFNIIGILSDNIENVEEWKSLIKNHELKWEHYLDLNLKKANKFSIKKFPTNYLMDKNGIIVAKDLRPEELNAFLNSHINKIKD
jgi:thiol-disulfide isomerase/thioredoxin